MVEEGSVGTRERVRTRKMVGIGKWKEGRGEKDVWREKQEISLYKRRRECRDEGKNETQGEL